MDYLKINKAGWDKRTELHIDSEFYKHEAFLKGRNSLREIEMGILGDLKGLKVLHLQCHFGQDSISLARLGAQVTAVDLSSEAIRVAEETAKDLGIDVRFICSDVLAKDLLKGEEFDLVFTSYGAIPWLPDLKPWASLIKDKLKPNGRFILIEFHPVVHMFDDDMKGIAFSYFNEEAISGGQEGTYAQSDNEEIPYVVWNHSLAEVINVLTNEGLTIQHFDEYNYSPYPCFDGMIEQGTERYIIEQFGSKLPLCYSLIVNK